MEGRETEKYLRKKKKKIKYKQNRSKFHNFFVFNYVFLFFIIFKIDKFIF